MKTESITIAITGATGFVGSEAVRYFSQKKFNVIQLTRSVNKNNRLQRYYNMSEDLPSDLLRNVDYLVHTAYIQQGKEHPNAFKENVDAAEKLFQNAKANKVKKVLFMSSMSAHDKAVSKYGKQKLAIEKLAADVNGISIRAGLIIGNGGIVMRMSTFMRKVHMVPLVGGGAQPIQIVAISDLLRAIDHLTVKRFSGTVTLATAEVYTYKEFYKSLAKYLRIKVLFLPIPLFILSSVANILDNLGIRGFINKDNVLGLKMLTTFDTNKDLEFIGVALKPLDKALEGLRIN